MQMLVPPHFICSGDGTAGLVATVRQEKRFSTGNLRSAAATTLRAFHLSEFFCLELCRWEFGIFLSQLLSIKNRAAVYAGCATKDVSESAGKS